MKQLRAIIAIILLLINMFWIASLVILFSGLTYLLPTRWRHACQAWMQQLPVWWMDANAWILQLATYKKWRVEGHASLDKKGWYLLICNHQSWMDILVLGIFFRDKVPILKFFMKKELLWTLPLAGLASYLLGYPFMARHSHEDIRKNPELKTKDLETTRKSCDKFKEFPTTVMNFVEGTRFTKKKHAAQQSPYQHLLKPKATGVALVLNELHGQLNGIINATVHYTPKNLSLWQFLCGDIKEIYLHYELIPIAADLIGDPYEDRRFRKNFQLWLNEVWLSKDQRLQSLAKE